MAAFPTYGVSGTGAAGGITFPTYGSGSNALDTPEALLALANIQGGAVAQAANEIYHPSTGILSSIGAGMKNAFQGFVDIISKPSYAVAGILDPNRTIGEAIQERVTPSDVIFGEKDPNATIYKKTGSFLVRTAVDIMLDPLTYLTLGTGAGVLGIRSTAKVTLQGAAAARAGKEVFSTAALSKEGQGLFNYVKKLENQIKGGTSSEIVRTGNTAFDLAGDELKALAKATIDSELSEDLAKKAISNLFEKNPAYVDTFLDKGGIKYFGKTLLSSQRIASTIKTIPGMTQLDQITLQSRLAVQSLFNPNIKKIAHVGWTRVPAGIVEMGQRYRDLFVARGDKSTRLLDDVVREFNLSDTEAEFLMSAAENKMLPRDARLQGAMKTMLGYAEEDWNKLVSSGLLSKEIRLEGFAPHILVKNNVKNVGWSMPPSTETGATKLREIATYTPISKTVKGETTALTTGQAITGHAGKMGLKLIEEGENKGLFTNSAGDLFQRAVEPIHGQISPQQFRDIEETVLKNPKVAAKMLEDMRQDGFKDFDANLITAWAARTIQNTKAVTMKDFLREFGQAFGRGEAHAGENWVRINSPALKKAAPSDAGDVISMLDNEGDLFFHPAMASYIEDFMGGVINDDATMAFFGAYDKVQNAWKASVTSIWPAFHGRNAISNAFQNFLDLGVHALNPKIHTVSLNLIYNDRQLNRLQRKAMAGNKGAQAQAAELMGRVMFEDATGHAWTMGELRQVAKNNNIAFTSRIVTSNDVRAGADATRKALFAPRGVKDIVTNKYGVKESVKGAIKQPFKFGQEVVGRTIEEHARLVNFVANLRKTGDVTTAAQRTKQFLFDYENLTNFEKMFLRRLIPFYTFTRKNLELQVRALLTTPGRIGAEIHALSTLGEVISGGQQLSEDEYKALPDWVKSGIGILTKKNGDQITLITGLGTPIEQPFAQLQANVLLGSVSPLMRLPLEQLSGYSFFQGKPLSEVTNAAAFVHAPKVIQDLVGFTELKGKKSDGTPYTWYVSLHPEMMNFILNLPPTTRVFTALKQMDAVDVSDQAKLLQQITGLRPYSFDLQRERDKREKEMMSELENILTKAGITAQFKRTFIPKEKKNQLITQ